MFFWTRMGTNNILSDPPWGRPTDIFFSFLAHKQILQEEWHQLELLKLISSVESQKGIKGITTVQKCSFENQKGASAIKKKSMVIVPF